MQQLYIGSTSILDLSLGRKVVFLDSCMIPGMEMLVGPFDPSLKDSDRILMSLITYNFGDSETIPLAPALGQYFVFTHNLVMTC